MFDAKDIAEATAHVLTSTSPDTMAAIVKAEALVGAAAMMVEQLDALAGNPVSKPFVSEAHSFLTEALKELSEAKDRLRMDVTAYMREQVKRGEQ